jgi:predicted AlkP superfamily phosphohydrolase/phosphomutase/tetratricopeptide (TPR) repeat protein
VAKVLLIGWDAADWKVIHPLMDEGKMPALKKLVESGVMGKMATLDPPLSPMLWTSIATGKRPYKHGIHGFTEPTPDGKALRPIYNTNRKCEAIWNILSHQQKKCHVVGWWPSHPAEPINGTMISNFYQKAGKSDEKNWDLIQGVIHPTEKTSLFAQLRVHPNEITSAHIYPFVPDFEKVDQVNDKRLHQIAAFIAESASIHSAATYIMDNEEWDFMAVYFDAIDHFCHAFMRYHPPHREHIPLWDYNMYKDVVAGAYIYHDMMLERYLELAGDDTTIMLISDHGFHPGSRRPLIVPNEPTGPAAEHSPYGIIAMKGPNIKKDETIFGSSLLDITPTLLYTFGYPVARDMDGKILIQAFSEENPIEYIDSWDTIVKADIKVTSVNNDFHNERMKDELQQLIDLGYISDPGPDIQNAIIKTVNENNFNLARAYINGQEWESAISILEDLHQQEPNTVRFANYLLHAYLITGKHIQARKLLEHIRSIVDAQNAQMDLMEGTLLLAEQRPVKALEMFEKVEKEAGDQPQLQLKLANAYFQLNKYKNALDILEKALRSDPEEAASWYLAGICRFSLGEYDLAVENLLNSIGLQFYFPPAHYYVGESLMAMEKYEDSARAFELCLKIAPSMNLARKRLYSIYSQFLNQQEKANLYLEAFDQAIKGEIIIVSGLPRSGTSMMMQMLQAGGLDIFTDHKREADENNLKGYLEHEEVKNLAKNKTWLPKAVNKCVKVVTQLLPALPLNYKYKIIFMEREISEVISSQEKMLIRLGKQERNDIFPTHLVQEYKNTLSNAKNWIENQRNIEVIYIDYNNVLKNTFNESLRINDFLNGTLNVHEMVSAVDENLKREGKKINFV